MLLNSYRPPSTLLKKRNLQSPGVRNTKSIPWFQRRPELLEDIKQALHESPWLHLNIEAGVPRITGTIPVPSDRYSIEILFLRDYPKTLPQVRETGGRIPRTCDRHVNQSDGTACVCIPDEWIIQRPDESFSTFLKGPVYNFFLSQKTFEVQREWPLGQRPHGNPGLLEFYQEFFKTTDPQLIKKHLECLSRKALKGHWDCPCGSGKRLRNCHHQKLVELSRKLPRRIASEALTRLQSFL